MHGNRYFRKSSTEPLTKKGERPMKGKLARCANCGKSARYCANKGCRPNPSPDVPVSHYSTGYLPPDLAAIVYNERETAQWYATVGYQVMRDELAALPDAERRQCFEYGGLVTWNRLPVSAKNAIAAKRAEIIANGERMQAEIDARNA
jgi:hypothetical protein